MAQQNIELVKSLYAAFGARDIPAIMSRISPDMTVVQSHELPWGGTYEAPGAFMRFIEKLTGSLNNTGLVIDRYLDAGDHVVAIGRTQGTVLANGKPFDVPLAHVWEIRDGKAVRFSPYIDNPTMLEALRS